MILPVKIAITVLLLALATVIKMAEASVFGVAESELEAPLAENKKAALRVSALKKASERSHPAIRTALTATEFQMTALAAVFFSPYLAVKLLEVGLSADLAATLSAIIWALISAFATVLFVAVFARHVAIKHSLKVSMALSCFIKLICAIYTPLSTLVSAIGNLVFIPMGINAKKQDTEISEETIKMMVDAGSEQGNIDSDEKEFIENVFAFDDLTADEVATHRTGITILWSDETAEEWEKTITESHHSYFPICEDKIDNVIGVLSAKDYFRLKDRSRDSVMKHAVKAPYYIPESMKANAILKSMKQKRVYFAVVIDEYGGMSGIVTVTDLLQCIVGEIFDEEDGAPQPEIEPLDSKTWMIRGSAAIDEVEDALGVSLEGDYGTFAGYVLTMVGSIPDDGVVFTVENDVMTVRITAIKDRRIERTMVQLKEAKESE